MKLSDQLKRAGFIQATEGKHDESVEMTDKQFMDYYHKNSLDFIPIDWNGRTKFLKDNGYEVTHANMINADLSAKPQTKEK